MVPNKEDADQQNDQGLDQTNQSSQFNGMTSEEREKLVVDRIRQCCVVYDFSLAPLSDLAGKDMKRDILAELIEYISINQGVITEAVTRELIQMFSINAFRTLPPSSNPLGKTENMLSFIWWLLYLKYAF